MKPMIALTDQVDQLFAKWDTTETPGCVLAVIRDGEIAYSRAYGMADLERDVLLSAESVLDLGSTGKQFTAMLTLLLEEQGLLALSDPIQKYIPELPAYSAEITIAHLIYHTSGVRDYTTLMYTANKPFENRYNDHELFDLITRQQAANFAPGEEWLYSNSGYLLLGVIASRVGGKSYTELVREYILEPLGMTRTTFNDTFTRIVKHRALAYSPGENGYTTDISFCGGYGDGAMLSCVGDLLLWDRNFYANKLGKSGQALIEKMLTVGTLNDGTALDYAGGLFVREHKGLRLVSHGGAWAGYRAELLRFPDQRLAVICLANLADLSPSTLALQVAELYLADQMKESAPEAEAETVASEPAGVDAAKFTGSYRSANGGSIVSIVPGESGLMLEIMGYSFPVQAVNETTLKTAGAPIEIVVTALDGGAVGVSLAGQAATPYQPLAQTDAAPLTTGEYYSPELGIAYRISQDGDEAFVQRGYAPQEPLKPVSGDLYASGFMIFQFTRNDAGEVVGFDLFADRVVDLHFERRAS
jgi:CubicO group peptidase (beta-lactamase class C family)